MRIGDDANDDGPDFIEEMFQREVSERDGAIILVDEAADAGTGRTNTSVKLAQQLETDRKQSTLRYAPATTSRHPLWDKWCQDSAEREGKPADVDTNQCD